MLCYFRMAMGSNVAFALRSIMKKNLPKDFKVNSATFRGLEYLSHNLKHYESNTSVYFIFSCSSYLV